MPRKLGKTRGFAVPQFVIDTPGGGGKIPIGPNYFLGETKDGVLLRNYEGLIFEYQNPVAESSHEEKQIKKDSFLGSERLKRRKSHKWVSSNSVFGKHYHGQRDWKLKRNGFSEKK